MSKVIIIMGVPGAGKGTQARLLSLRWGYPQISLGDILREMARADTPLGHEIKSTQAAGQLVKEEILAQVVLERTSQADCDNGYILEGFPRTLTQAKLLEKLALQQGNEIRILNLTVARQSVLKRLLGRRTCTHCGEIYNVDFKRPMRDGLCDHHDAPLARRSDDNPESINIRLSAYQQSTAPLISHYHQSRCLIEVNGDRTIKEVSHELQVIVNNLLRYGTGL
jgi:adenylate kinase